MRRTILPALLLAATLLAPAPLAVAWGQPAPTPAPRPPAERPAPRGPEARRAELDRAFAALKDAPDSAGAALVEGRIRQLWGQAITPSVTLLMNRGIRNLAANQAEDALEDCDAAITLGPEVAEAWHLRAQAQAKLGAFPAAARDLQEALRLEPRHWGALVTLAAMQEEARDLAGALRSLEAALAINPRLPGGATRRQELRRRVEGNPT